MCPKKPTIDNLKKSSDSYGSLDENDKNEHVKNEYVKNDNLDENDKNDRLSMSTSSVSSISSSNSLASSTGSLEILKICYHDYPDTTSYECAYCPDVICDYCNFAPKCKFDTCANICFVCYVDNKTCSKCDNYDEDIELTTCCNSYICTMCDSQECCSNFNTKIKL